MYMNQYQLKAHEYAAYDDDLYPWLALAEEAGEVAGKMAKQLRGDGAINKQAVAKELGDTLWMLQEVARQCGYTLEDIATMNLQKLWDRQDRGVIQGEGDNR